MVCDPTSRRLSSEKKQKKVEKSRTSRVGRAGSAGMATFDIPKFEKRPLGMCNI